MNILKVQSNILPIRLFEKGGYSVGSQEEVIVLWDDAVMQAAPMSVVEARGLKPTRTERVGWLVHQDDKVLILASQRSIKTGNYREILAIPAGNIVKVTKLFSP